MMGDIKLFRLSGSGVGELEAQSVAAEKSLPNFVERHLGLKLFALAFILAGVTQLTAPAAETDGTAFAQNNEKAAGHLQPGTGMTNGPTSKPGADGGSSGIAGGFVIASKDMELSRALTSRLLSGPACLPVSFMLDGKAVNGIPAGWGPVSHRRRIDANLIETTFEGCDAKTGLGLRVECVEYLDYPAVEWVAWLTNRGNQPTPIISDIAALDGRFDGASPVLHHNNGDFYSEKGYDEQETALGQDVSLRFAPSGGRPCDNAFPYYRVAFKDYGLSIAIGWPAQWSAAFTGLDGGVRIRAGQEKTHLRLMPGETVRTPRMTVMSWTGDATRAANLWRRWYRDHVLPRTNGRPLGPMSVAHGTDDGEEFTAATGKNQVQYMDLWAKRGIRFDVWWIDAGWYPCYDNEHRRRWPNTGTWEPDPERFPAGLKSVSDHAARQGADLLIWFEPERVTPGTSLDREHPDWLLRVKGSGNRLLNLGNPACRQWLTDHVCKLIQDNGIKVYRQDHNFAPLQFWRDNDAEDRQGMNENLHVQGYLRYWDDLLARNPGLWIDSCASGGRRNDMETMRRSVPLHYTDYGYGNHPVKLSFHHTLFQWLPYFKEVSLSWDLDAPARYDTRVDSFSYHCGLGPMIIPAIDIRRDDYDYDLLKKMLGIWRRAAGLMIDGDYYPLTPIHRSPEKWVARQFDCPETGRGFIQGIRLPACAEETLVVHPKAIRADAIYLLENPESGETKELAGRALEQAGLTFTLPKRQGAIWFYRVQ
ncbi:MAG: alpha-galactosidase [Phycisphaerae bacterium]|nr:alpha-galactosidase [Phycisphaerae bacterium]